MGHGQLIDWHKIRDLVKGRKAAAKLLPDPESAGLLGGALARMYGRPGF
ncbi:hypothetical protein [Streptomyces sp. NRRL B-24572]|nr:hypothetical protein [Streptomyces sp. NRRL B-24572]